MSAIVSFYLLLITVVLILFGANSINTPYIALWLLLAVFAPVFGSYGSGAIIGIAGACLLYLYQHGSLGIDDTGAVVLVGILPLAIGMLAWRADKETDTEEDRSYSELASKLSSISGQSEVVIASITNGVVVVDPKSLITLINPAAARIIGWGRDDAIGLDYHSVLKLIDAKDQPLSDQQDPVQQALITGKEVKVDTFQIVTIDAEKKLLISIVASPISNGGGAIIVFRDITGERAEERQRAEFISTASHEMRTPVASIEGYLGLALNPATATIDSKARDYITKAHESAQHLGRLFQDLLDVSKADDGRLQNNPHVIDVVPFVHDITLGLLPKAHEKSLFVDFKPNPDLENPSSTELDTRVISPAYFVNVDGDHLREVVANLIENAIKYTLHGSITIDVTGDDSSVIISVADSGIGIAAEDIPHLFQKFYRIDNTDTREIGGTGLGLYLCRRLTEAMGGKIWVESTFKQGSVFYVNLPRMDAVEAQRRIEELSSAEISQVGVPASTAATTPPTPPQDIALAAPTPQPQPVPTTPAAPQPQTQPSMATPPFTPAPRQNIPLSTLEQNARQYTRSGQIDPSQPGRP